MFFEFGNYFGEHGFEFKATGEIEDSPYFDEGFEDMVVIGFRAFASDFAVGVGNEDETRAVRSADEDSFSGVSE